MDITLSKKYDIIPEWNGNSEEENPIVFKCSYLSNEQFDSCMSVGSEITINRTRVLKLSVDKIENMTVDGKPIYSPAEFIKIKGVGGLFSEVTTEMILKNNGDLPKN